MSAKKYFVTSDIHSYYEEFKTALRKAGFDKGNPDHILVVDGDLFDRGPGAVPLYKFITTLPKSRRILIRGNHEDMLCDICDKGYFEDFNLGNSTDQTIYQFVKNKPVTNATYSSFVPSMITEFKNTGIPEWIRSPEFLNYAEIGNFLLTHAFIPLADSRINSAYNGINENLSYLPDWRKLEPDCQLWQDARWGCPYDLFEHFFGEERKKGKILVCGHWHVQDFHSHYEGTVNNSHIYCHDGLIGLDACTPISGRCNVLVIEENGKCYDGADGKELNPSIL